MANDNDQENKFHPITFKLYMAVLEALTEEEMTRDMAIPTEFHLNVGKKLDKIVREKLVSKKPSLEKIMNDVDVLDKKIPGVNQK